MVLGIVGSEQAKFTRETESIAREVIRALLTDELNPVEIVISGACHLGGVDIYAREIALDLGIPFIEHKPKTRGWKYGYQPRNILIAEDSDKVTCITLEKYHDDYRGMRFNRCYHCQTSDHVKSGGCWTVKYARRIGRLGEIVVV